MRTIAQGASRGIHGNLVYKEILARARDDLIWTGAGGPEATPKIGEHVDSSLVRLILKEYW